MYGWRRCLLRLFGAKIGKGVLIRSSVHVQFPWKIAIGDNSWIGDNVVLYSLGQITIGKNVVVSQRSYLCSASHDYSITNFPIYSRDIEVLDECWLATDVFVAPGVKIDKGSVVGARSSVFNNLPGGMVCIGSPAKPIKKREMKLEVKHEKLAGKMVKSDEFSIEV
jgi:putative colanic acid biosynthesis acetyltransferase WcaF